MRKSAYILGDWGTSRLRLRLYESPGELLQTVEGRGVKDVSDFEAEFLAAASEFKTDGHSISVFLAGMAGSNIGWRETAYIPCPASPADIFERAVAFSFKQFIINILPGASCVNRFGYPDLMRGEETQIIGIAESYASDDYPRLLCLPGTHVKWALAKGAQLLRFETSMQGELFDIVNRHSILTRQADAAAPINPAAFLRAVDLMRENEHLPTSEALFATRTYELLGELPSSNTPSFLSGVMIGADIRDIAMRIIAEEKPEGPVILAGEKTLTELYARALERWDIEAEMLDGATAAFTGLERFRAFRAHKEAAI